MKSKSKKASSMVRNQLFRLAIALSTDEENWRITVILKTIKLNNMTSSKRCIPLHCHIHKIKIWMISYEIQLDTVS